MTTATIQVRERPIIFSGPMVRAILEGRKTQTRRVVAFLPEYPNAQYVRIKSDARISKFDSVVSITQVDAYAACPYGKAGDRLWVREALRWTDWLVYDSDKSPIDPDLMPNGMRISKDFAPSIFMPRWASRINLEIKDVRVERLQDISGADVLAEGIDNGSSNPTMGQRWENMQRMAWESGWNAINAKRGFGWDKNPWVWVIEFKSL